MDKCESGALKVGVSYIYVDWRVCEGCLACVKACKCGAIQDRATPRSQPKRRSSQATAGGRVRAGTKGSGTGAKKSMKRTGGSKPAKRASAAASRAVEWTLLEAAVVLAVVLLAFVAKDAALTSSLVLDLPGSVGVFARVVVLGLFYGVQFAALMVLARRHGGFASAFGLERDDRPWWRSMVTGGLTLSLLIGTRLFTAFYGALVQYFGWDPPMAANGSLPDVFGKGSAGLVLAVLLVVFVGPLIEEVVFRSVLLSAFRDRWGAWAGILVSSSLFGLYHFSAWMFLPTFVLGLALGWLAHWRDGLWPPLVLHALYNGVAVIAAFYVAG